MASTQGRIAWERENRGRLGIPSTSITSAVLRRPGVDQLLRKAATAGADFIGGLDPASIDRDPVGQLDLLFDIAADTGAGIDIHLHDPAELGITMTTVAPLRLPQLPLAEFDAAGVNFGFGTDGIRDLWSPYGTGDSLGIAWQYARASSIAKDEDLLRVVRILTSGAAAFVGRDVHDLVPGARADIVLLDAENPMDALIRVPRRELVISQGNIVHQE